MAASTLQDFETHLTALQSARAFLDIISLSHSHDNDHENEHPQQPGWLAKEATSLSSRTAMLVDDFQRVKRRLAKWERKERAKRNGGTGGKLGIKAGTKRLSIEAARAEDSPDSTNENEPSTSDSPPNSVKRRKTSAEPESEIPDSVPASSSEPESEPQSQTEEDQREGEGEAEGGYEVQYVDVSAEVRRRLHETRIRHLMDSPSTAQKRKRDALSDEVEGDKENDVEGGDGNADEVDLVRSPVKKLKAFGEFEGVGMGGKKGNGSGRKRVDVHGDGDRDGDGGDVGEERERVNVKRRRL